MNSALRAHTHDLIIIGSGPAGLEMALAAASAGLDFLILERGEIADNIKSWSWVSLFSPWSMNVTDSGLDSADLSLKDPTGSAPAQEYLTRYLEPIANSETIKTNLLCHTRVISIGRSGEFKNTLIGDPNRKNSPFIVLAEQLKEGKQSEIRFFAQAVVDASGVYGTHRWLGSGGIPATGERANSNLISYTLEDPSADSARFENKHVTIIGDGYSACTMLESFATLHETGSNVLITWLTGENKSTPLSVDPNDPLLGRKQIGEFANKLASENNPYLKFLAGYQVSEIESLSNGKLKLLVDTNDSSRNLEFETDFVYAMIGYKPDRTLYEELQVHECWATSGPMKLAATLLSQAGGDCLTISGGGPETLQNPELGFFIIGAKSYGRNSQFLIDRLKEQIPAVLDQIKLIL